MSIIIEKVTGNYLSVTFLLLFTSKKEKYYTLN